MKQIFILGASSAYGVGSEQAGWGDLVKQYAHSKMYGANGVGEKCEVFNSALSGATIDFVLATFPEQIKQHGRGGEVTSIVSVGGNNSKAVHAPDNFVSSIEEYTRQMAALLTLLQASSTVIAVSNGYVDEGKTNPKLSPFDGSKSYFTNSRRAAFGDALKQLCTERNITFVDTGIGIEEWQQKYLYQDGLHPNQAGHQRIFEVIRPHLPF